MMSDLVQDIYDRSDDYPLSDVSYDDIEAILRSTIDLGWNIVRLVDDPESVSGVTVTEVWNPR